MKTSSFLRTNLVIMGVWLHLSTLCFRSHGAAGDVDLSFDAGSGVNGQVTALAVQPDGKVIIGGWFTTVQGLPRHGIARLNADGSGDSSFTAGFDAGYYGPPSVLTLQPDGKVLVGHYSGMLRLNGNGSLDNTFTAISTPYEDGVFAVVVQPDGKVIIGGQFTAINGTNRSGIARLNANGTLDTSFVPAAAVQASVSALALQPDGKVVISGWVVVNGTGARRIVRLNANGSLDNSFNLEQVSFGAVAAFAIQPDGKIVVGGHFSQGNGANLSGLARLNADGTPDAGFNPGATLTGNSYTGHTVNSLALQSDGRIVVGGSFAINTTNWINVARFNANGTLDTGFDPGTGAQGTANEAEVFAVTVQPDGQVLIGGTFAGVNGAIRNNLARLQANGGLETGFNHPGGQIDGLVQVVQSQPNGKVLIGGAFTTVNGFARNGLARLLPNGGVDSTFNPAISSVGSYRGISSIAAQPDGKVLIAGYFTTGSPQTVTIARLHADGSFDSSFLPDLTPFIQPGDCLPNNGCWQGVEATTLLLQPDGKVLVGGHARTTVYGDEWYYEVIRPFLGRFETNGTRDWSFTPGTNYSESCMVLQPDGKILGGGVEGIARLNTNGTLDPSFNAGAIGSIRSIALQPDGKLVLGGGFYAIQGTNHSGVLRLNANGSLDGSFNYGPAVSGAILSVALQPDGKVLVGGDYYFLNGTNYIYGITRRNANGSLDTSFNHGTDWGGAVRSVALQSDGNFLIGGNFTTVKGVLRPYVARLYGDPLPKLNIARSGGFAVLTWPASATGYRLEQSVSLLPGSWSNVPQSPVTNGGQFSVAIPMILPRQFFRLTSP
jgi:uncharacterized delta-60 repeat protein